MTSENQYSGAAAESAPFQQPLNPPLHVVFDRPEIPPNTGNAIRMCAGTGASLHLAGPLAFKFDDKHVRRAGLDYHELADVHVHEGIDEALDHVTDPVRGSGRVFAFTAQTGTWFTEVDYRPGDALLFGPEPTGLADDVLADPRVTAKVRIPMLPAYEAWRQLGFAGGV